MDDQIRYDYQAMMSAYDEMKSIHGKIEQERESLDSSGRQMVQAMGGEFVQEYDAKRTRLQQEVDSLNTHLHESTSALQEKFGEMQRTDQQLGAGI